MARSVPREPFAASVSVSALLKNVSINHNVSIHPTRKNASFFCIFLQSFFYGLISFVDGPPPMQTPGGGGKATSGIFIAK